MSSFNHRLTLEADGRERIDGKVNEFFGTKRCTRRNCVSRAKYWAVYDYVTGRAGRVGTNRQQVCETHGYAYASKHGCEVPDAP